jgi:group I intron endonuclease
VNFCGGLIHNERFYLTTSKGVEPPPRNFWGFLIYRIMIGIYKITSPTGKIYIGQSVNILRRFSVYKRNNESKKQPRLYGSFKKYGVNNHSFEIIENCDVSELCKRERYWQDFYDVIGKNGLNACLQKSDDKNYVTSIEVRKKISDSAKGRKHSKETKEKLSNKHKGKKLAKEHIDKIVSKLKGRKGHNKKATQETKELCRVNATKHKSKLVIDTNTGVFYQSAKEASDLLKIKHSTLRCWLNGTNKNQSSLIYC